MDGKRIIQFADSMSARIDEMTAKGYIPQFAVVRLIVWWKSTEDKSKDYTETKVILPDIHFTRKESSK